MKKKYIFFFNWKIKKIKKKNQSRESFRHTYSITENDRKKQVYKKIKFNFSEPNYFLNPSRPNKAIRFFFPPSLSLVAL